MPSVWNRPYPPRQESLVKESQVQEEQALDVCLAPCLGGLMHLPQGRFFLDLPLSRRRLGRVFSADVVNHYAS